MASLLRNLCRPVCSTNKIFKNISFSECRYLSTSLNIYQQLHYKHSISNPLLTKHYLKVISINGSRSLVSNNDIEKPGLVARFKQMYRDYWYVLVPVHIVTSACWLGGFYYLAKSGVDVIGLLKAMGVSDRFTDPLKDSSMGYVALAYALYKIATPLRYTVTLGGTTISIKYLLVWGYIKPIPSREELKEMYQTKKDGFQEMYQETRQELRQRKDQMRERKDHVMSDIARYKQEIREVKESQLKNK